MKDDNLTRVEQAVAIATLPTTVSAIAQVPEQLPMPTSLADYGLLAIALFALVKNLIN